MLTARNWGLRSTLRSEDCGSPAESPRMFPAEGGVMGFELIRNGVSMPDHNGPGIVG